MLSLNRTELIAQGAWIAGKAVGASESRTFTVDNPANGSLIATLPDCGAAEAKAAISAAHEAFLSWRKLLAKERADFLKAWYAVLKKNQEDLARLISLEQGKPLTESRGEVAYGAAYV